MKELFFAAAIFIIIGYALGAFDEEPADRYKAAFLEGCKHKWKDSGFQYRLSEPYLMFANSNVLAYDCQVNVNGRWVDQDNVKVG